MKRWIAIVMATATLASMAGCGGKADGGSTETGSMPTEAVVTTVPETTVPPTTSAATPSTEAPKPTEKKKMWVSATKPFTPPAEDPELTKELEAAGLTDVINSWETSPEEPAKLGQWVRASAYSAKSRKAELVFVRIVDTHEVDQAKIDAHDADKNDKYKLELHEELKDIAHLRGLTYEIYYPKAFPADEYGILGGYSFTLVNPNDFMGDYVVDGKTQYYMSSSMKPFVNDEATAPGSIITREGVYAVLNESVGELYVFDSLCHIIGSDNEDANYPFYIASE